jgi:hypothetical protein
VILPEIGVVIMEREHRGVAVATGNRFAVSCLIPGVLDAEAPKSGPVRFDLRQEDKLDPVGDVAPLLVGQVLPRAESGSAGSS